MEPKYAVYVVVVEDTAEAREALEMDDHRRGGHGIVEQLAAGVDNDEATRIVDEAREMDWGV